LQSPYSSASLSVSLSVSLFASPFASLSVSPFALASATLLTPFEYLHGWQSAYAPNYAIEPPSQFAPNYAIELPLRFAPNYAIELPLRFAHAAVEYSYV
jgi:hypothetical protein